MYILYSAPARAVFALYTSLRSVTKADCPTGLSKSENIRMIFTYNKNLSITWKNHHHHVSYDNYDCNESYKGRYQNLFSGWRFPQLLLLDGLNHPRRRRRFHTRAGGALGGVGGEMDLGRIFGESELSVR